MGKAYFVRRGTQTIGPITSHALRELALQGKVAPTDFVKREDSEWVNASKVEGLFVHPAAPSPSSAVPSQPVASPPAVQTSGKAVAQPKPPNVVSGTIPAPIAPVPIVPPSSSADTFASVSMGLSFVGCLFLPAVVSIVLGWVALARLSESAKPASAKTRAIVGISLSGFWLLCLVVAPFIPKPETPMAAKEVDIGTKATTIKPESIKRKTESSIEVHITDLEAKLAEATKLHSEGKDWLDAWEYAGLLAYDWETHKAVINSAWWADLTRETGGRTRFMRDLPEHLAEYFKGSAKHRSYTVAVYESDGGNLVAILHGDDTFTILR